MNWQERQTSLSPAVAPAFAQASISTYAQQQPGLNEETVTPHTVFIHKADNAILNGDRELLCK